jgi:hypothetical protein
MRKGVKKEMKQPSTYIVNMLNHNKNKLNYEERKVKSQLKKTSTNDCLL